MRIIFLLSLLCFGALTAQSQEAGSISVEGREIIADYEDTLQVLSVLMVTDSVEKNRFAAVRKMIPTLVKALQVPNSYSYSFDKLRSISVQYAPDSTFRIFTWQLFVDENTYRYYGAIQMNRKELVLHPLIDRSFEIDQNLMQAELPADKWYGSLYYNLMQLDHENGPRYILLGYDQYSLYRRRKVMDVLHFDSETGKPVFGAPVIPIANGNKLHRLVLEYSAEAKVRFNYDPNLELIVFDHLIPMEGRFGEGQVNVPDGSYQAYRIEDGQLTFVDKVFDQVSEQPPREEPVFDGKRNERDILGRKKGGGGR